MVTFIALGKGVDMTGDFHCTWKVSIQVVDPMYKLGDIILAIQFFVSCIFVRLMLEVE